MEFERFQKLKNEQKDKIKWVGFYDIENFEEGRYLMDRVIDPEFQEPKLPSGWSKKRLPFSAFTSPKIISIPNTNTNTNIYYLFEPEKIYLFDTSISKVALYDKYPHNRDFNYYNIQLYYNNNTKSYII